MAGGSPSTQTVYGSGLNVYTALDVVAQTQTEEVINAKLEYLEDQLGRNGDQPLQAAGALVDPYTGAMVAVYGGRDSTATGFNRATQARRQAGSSFKPLVYALAFSRMDGDGMPLYTAADTVPNERRTFENTDGWRPRNVGGKYTPSIPLAQALASSSNIGTASLLEELGGPRHLVDFADRLGFEKRCSRKNWTGTRQGEVTPLEMAGFAAAVITGVMSTGSLFAGPRCGPTDPKGLVARGPGVPEAAALTMELIRVVLGIEPFAGSTESRDTRAKRLEKPEPQTTSTTCGFHVEPPLRSARGATTRRRAWAAAPAKSPRPFGAGGWTRCLRIWASAALTGRSSNTGASARSPACVRRPVKAASPFARRSCPARHPAEHPTSATKTTPRRSL